ncbi:MAG: YkgJ family cysteine cluster protein [Myxococcales bacterium]
MRLQSRPRGSPLDTFLEPGDRLPLTCSRSGTCCHNKAIFLNPWELACLAREKGLTPKSFRQQFTVGGGLRLRMDDRSPKATCALYAGSTGCSVYLGRPLACRLFPLGRQRQGEQVVYLHRGQRFPCLAECPEVVGLPQLTVEEFLRGQQVRAGEAAQDAYLEVSLELAEGALVLLLEGGLVEHDDTETLIRWRALGELSDAERGTSLPPDWLDALTVPSLEAKQDAPQEFAARHFELLQEFEASLPEPEGLDALRERCCLRMAASLFLGRGVGSEAKALAERWIQVAVQHGAPPPPPRR